MKKAQNITHAKKKNALDRHGLKKSLMGEYLNDKELEMMLNHGKTVFFPSGSIIVQQGKKIAGLYMVIEGSVNINARMMGERVADMDILGPGYFLGELCFIGKFPCTSSAIAAEPVKCLLISSTYFELLSTYYPETKYKILSAISIQICNHIKRIHDKVADCIRTSDMMRLSFFGRMLHSLTQPKQTTLNEKGLNTDLLQKRSIFQQFNAQEMEELIQHSQFLEAPKNCILIHEREKSRTCFIVIQGAVQSSIMEGNKIAKLSVIGPGSLFAGIACIDHDSTFTISFITCEGAQLLKISEKAIQYFQKNNPQLWYKLFNLICESLAALGKSINKLDVRLNIEIYNR